MTGNKHEEISGNIKHEMHCATDVILNNSITAYEEQINWLLAERAAQQSRIRALRRSLGNAFRQVRKLSRAQRGGGL